MSPKTTPSSTQPLQPCYMSEEELKEQFSRAKIATAGARALEMLADPAYDHFSFYDFLCEMMLAQDTNRKANATRKAIAGAHFANPNISIEHISPNPETGLSAQRLARLKDSEWIIGPNTQNLIIIGPTGSGKSYLAQAIGVNACINQLKVRYWRLAELARHFDALRDNAFALDSLTQQLAKYHLLIIDDFYTTEISRHASSLLFSLMDAREGQATVIVSQLEPQDWMKQISNQVTAESLINRILHPSMVIRLDGKTNLRAQHNPSEAI